MYNGDTCDDLCGGLLILCAVIYEKKRVICIHLVIHSFTKQLDERAVLLNLIQAGVRGKIFVCNFPAQF